MPNQDLRIFKKLSQIIYFFIVCFTFVFISAAFWDFYLENKKRPDLTLQPISFTTQFLHPYYFFSLPTRSDLLQKINSEKYWVDKRGFRGPGPEEKGSRQLAFLIGGSTAFGDGASANEKAITAVLNRVQQKYFFVNAGVPSWNSFQELLRYLKQVQNEKPSLVVSLSGFNDIIIAFERIGSDLPADAPASFEALDSWVENIRSNDFRKAAVEKYSYETSIFRHLRLVHVRKLLGIEVMKPNFENYKNNEATPLNKDISLELLIDQVADRYLENMGLIKTFSDAKQTQFLVFFQPYQFAPKKFDKKLAKRPFRQLYLGVREKILKTNLPFLVDISEPLNNSTLNEKDIFIDSVHFNDVGYEYIAKLMWAEILKKTQL